MKHLQNQKRLILKQSKFSHGSHRECSLFNLVMRYKGQRLIRRPYKLFSSEFPDIKCSIFTDATCAADNMSGEGGLF